MGRDVSVLEVYMGAGYGQVIKERLKNRVINIGSATLE